MKLWVDGVLGDESELRVSPLDHGLLVGDGAFETLRVYRGVPFAWHRHLRRLERSAGGLGLHIPPEETLRAAADAVLAANELLEARLRITITGGRSPLGSERGSAPVTRIVAASELAPWKETAGVCIVPWRRNERGATTGLKTISYADNVRALAYAYERGADEAIFANTRDELCEATGSNVFVAREGILRTPPASAGCLLGVTRALLITLAERASIPLEEVALPIAALAESEEAFLSSTTREVQAIAAVDGRPLPDAPGPITRRLAGLFRELVASDIDP
jgi:branched-chain amino acid aminotransferase